MLSNEVWSVMQNEAKQMAEAEPLLASYIDKCILQHQSMDVAVAFVLAQKLADDVMPQTKLWQLFTEFYQQQTDILEVVAFDIRAVFERDPAIQSYLTVLLHLKGFQAIQVHRLAHHLWNLKRKDLALFIQSRNSQVLAVDIHPACRMGKGVMFDHATGIVVGETAVIEDNVSILQSVTLGGTGNESGDRHPKIRHGVMIGAGAKVLGNIEVGCNSKVGAGSVILKDVHPHTTVVGVPAKQVGIPRCAEPCRSMQQNIFDDSQEPEPSQERSLAAESET
ncbi:serine O-acetyltransferase [Catenovulum sediminis]|uniref:serine O-acetyltransferase n=1 Tax=Catenovulum sediminis TaxID=1740262 RepID=UPI00117F2F03|nr:serine O-acetyltransferase [Catenovulum sediminis]